MASDHPIPTDPRFQNLTDKTFDLLLVESYGGKRGEAHYWNCLCACGRRKPIAGTSLRRGASTNCGCRRQAKSVAARRTHGRTGTPEYRVWHHMIRRCHERTNHKYADYGGRGITVCERWRKSFAAFLADMGERPTPKHQIERKDNDGPYSPENCVWATPATQARNRRSTRHLTHQGVTLCVKDWADRVGLNRNTIHDRLKRGLPVDQVLDPSTAVRYRRRSNHSKNNTVLP